VIAVVARVQAIQEVVDLVFADGFDGMVVPFDRTGVGSRYALPLSLRQLIFSDLKRLGDLDVMDGPLIRVTVERIRFMIVLTSCFD
jgi:hypothetical protein